MPSFNVRGAKFLLSDALAAISLACAFYSRGDASGLVGTGRGTVVLKPLAGIDYRCLRRYDQALFRPQLLSIYACQPILGLCQ